MGFNKVYKSLLEIFPQIDARVLRAVAIEHSMDIDVAAEAVLLEVVPFLSEKPYADANAPNVNEPYTYKMALTGHDNGRCLDAGKEKFYPHANDDLEDIIDVYNAHEEVDKNAESCPEPNVGECSHGELNKGIDVAVNKVSDLGKPCTDSIHFDQGNASGTVHEPESSIKLVVQPDLDDGSLEELDGKTCTSSELENSSRGVDPQHGLTMAPSLSVSTQKRTTEVLEELIVGDARDYKKTLLSVMQSVISLMMEVELKEQSAEQAKAEAVMGDKDVLAKVDELKQMAQRAAAENWMRGREVYGEKAILATELRELHHRVLSLSDERDKYLNVLNEMRQALDWRLVAAENEIISAKQEKVEKGKAARKTQAELELALESLMQEAETLKQQAVDNERLHEFLMDRGRAVDALQGEIAVICQDAKLLKERFDDNVPFGKSLSSSQTSCKLASSSSSFRSLTMEQVDSATYGADEKKTDMTSESGEPLPSAETAVKDDDIMALLDDGWEVCDNAEA